MEQTQTAQGVLVAGSINMDIVATTSQIPVPGQTVAGDALSYYPGGKGANQAIAAQRAGAPTRMLGKVGTDAFGADLQAFLAAEKIDFSGLSVAQTSSGVALIVVQANGENSIVVVPGANGEVSEADVTDSLFAGIGVGMSQYEIPIPTIESFFRSCRERNILTILNTAPAIADIGNTFTLADILVLNETELGTYAGTSLQESSPASEVLKQAKAVRAFDEQIIIVTLGAAGAVALAGEQEIEVGGVEVNAVDTTGAGDCFVGYMGACLAKGDPLEAALDQANAAAAQSVLSPGAGPSMPFLNDLLR